jgi:HAD superfamily hydrolase (TIGR01509 family)
MTLSAVLFDMDGLLVDTEPLWLDAEHETLAALGGTWSEADQRAIMGSSMAHATAYMRRSSGTDRTDAQVADLLVGAMLRRLAVAEIPIQPGVPELLREVAASGVPRALVSASARPIVDLVCGALLRAGLPEFPVTVAGDEVERSKPDPLPYLRAAEILGIDITRAVVLEDSANGARSGWAAGATVLAVPHAVPIEPAERIVVRPSLEGIGMADLRALVG